LRRFGGSSSRQMRAVFLFFRCGSRHVRHR
jgi:hypothetical protein